MKPILFNTEMVKAILEGRKTQTRRVVNKEYLGLADIDGNNIYIEDEDGNHFNILETSWAKYKVGDILYVKEPCKIMTLKGCHTDKSLILVYKYRNDITNTEYEIKLPDRFYKKDNAVPDWVSWFGKIIIPSGSIKEMARIFLKVTNVRIERLQDMKEHDAYREGVDYINSPHYGKLTETRYKDYENSKIDYKHYNAKESFISFWNSTAKDGYKWEDNPYVFVYEFERIFKED